MEMQTKDNEVDLISIKRNPYLEDYENGWNRNAGRNRPRPQREAREPKRGQAKGYARQRRPMSDSRRVRAAKKRQIRKIRRTAIFLGIIAFAILGVSLFAENRRSAAAGGPSKTASGGVQNANTVSANTQGTADKRPAETTSQGISAEDFARHPEWTEDFLTPNEYSRPGDELKEVKNIFVHYTANPGTSAAQNRSYFERQKDEHLASVSSHFIIGYEGEIIQCIPLDEIAYAVQTRNFDSVSIECCYKAKDGAFTKETYNSLITLLAWLTDAYDLDTEDILRHYDCGGKKCPLYYTNHADKWELLKEDVKKARKNSLL